MRKLNKHFVYIRKEVFGRKETLLMSMRPPFFMAHITMFVNKAETQERLNAYLDNCDMRFIGNASG